MPFVGLIMVVIALVIVAVVAFYLIRVIGILRSVNDALGKITFGVRAIAHRTAPLAELLAPAKDDLVTIADALDGAAKSVSSKQPAA